jgi:hypothetical protein
MNSAVASMNLKTVAVFNTAVNVVVVKQRAWRVSSLEMP